MRRDYISIKRATVALALLKPEGRVPFTIVGSGFCVDSAGIIVTCAHVIRALIDKKVYDEVAAIPQAQQQQLHTINIKFLRPFALFYISTTDPIYVPVALAPVDLLVGRQDRDLGLIRTPRHDAFKDGFPTVEIESYSDVYEGLEIGTYGFPLGNFLHQQIGTVTSSLTRGTLSSVIPSSSVPQERVSGFQLDITATHGNSGGPVFSLESGKVFGVLQQGIFDRHGGLLPGFAKAESIYAIKADEVAMMRNTPSGSVPRVA
jgi:S1-C subfamily serine protease